MAPESRVKDKIKKKLKHYKIFYFMPPANGYGTAGIPDFVCCSRGRFFAIEAKAKSGALTALQQKAMADINAAGGWTFVQWGDDDYSTLDAHLRLLA